MTTELPPLPQITTESLLMTKVQVAQEFQVCVRQLENLIKGERFPKPIRLSDKGHPRWRREDLIAYLRAMPVDA